jgi:hypothetical protein
MSKGKQTGAKAASNASETLRDKATGDESKSAAGSAMSQRHAPGKETSPKAAGQASDTLRDGRTSKSSKSAAGSAMSQKPSKS